MVMLEFAIMVVAIRMWQDGNITIGGFALIQALIFGLFIHLWDIGRYIRQIYERLALSEEMTEILLSEHGVKDHPEASTLKVKEGKIEFEQVSFAYHQTRKIFNKFDLKITHGERVALIGPSGGGKTSIIKLLLRLYDIESGSIKIDGTDIAKVTQDSLRKNIAMVPQDPILFHRTLMENIRYGKTNATKEEVIKASKMAHCHEFISQLPEAYDTYVGERGVKLSGGERQRVSIARAILADAPILILDEATSSLDSESERYIQDALKNLMKGRTNIVIAHRLSTIMQMDRILVLEKGKVTEEGTHQELLKIRRGTYQKLWEIQAGGFS
ncbi:hypothetical protein CL634_08980 [bacterium]|nr:hypothetical protein [bacterium]